MNLNIIPNMRLGVGEHDIQYFATLENIEILSNKPPHNNWLTGLIKLINFLKDKNINTMAEIGSYQGESTTIFATYLTNTKIYSIEPFIPNYDLNDIAALQNMENVQFNYNQRISKFNNITHIKMTSNDAYYTFSDNSLDFVYIDGDHRYNGVINDLRWVSKIKKGGYVGGHDYGREEINRAISETIKTVDLVFEDSSWIKRVI